MSSSHRGSDGLVLLFIFYFLFFLVLILLVLKFWFEFVFWLRAPSILCFTVVLSVFFFLLDSRGHYGKSAKRAFSLQAFPPDLGGKNLWARERKFSPGFSFLSIYSRLPNSGKQFSTLFSSLCFPSFLNSPQPNIVLKFGDDWISHPKISEFEFYPLKFGDIWILHPDISEFKFYPINFKIVWILLSKFFGVFTFYTLNFQNLEV